MSRSWHRRSLFQEETKTSAGNQVWGEERDEMLPRKEAWSICFSCFVLQKKRGNKPPNGTWKVKAYSQPCQRQRRTFRSRVLEAPVATKEPSSPGRSLSAIC